MFTQTKYYLTALLFFSAVCQADDTDIYINNSAGNNSPPMVMFSIDYQTNLGNNACTGTECDGLIADGYMAATGPYTTFDVLRGVLKKVLEPLGDMKIGLMMNHAHNNACAGPNKSGCSGGSYILHRLTPITSKADEIADPTTYASEIANKQAFHAKLAAIPDPGGNLNHTHQGKEMFFELFRYLTGQGVYSGHLGYKDFGDNTVSTNLDTTQPLIKRDMAAENTATYNTIPPGNYITPFDTSTDHCGRVFTVNFMFQTILQEDDADTGIQATKANGGMEGITFGGNGGSRGGAGAHSTNEFQTVLYWLNNVDLADGSWGSAPNLHGEQNVTSFFVDAVPADTSANGYANAGGTTAAYDWSDNPDELVNSLQAIFAQILSVSTTFTAASVPVSVLNRAEIIDNVYIALFRADEQNRQRWPGNLKKLKLDLSDPNALLKDFNDVNAVAADGRIKFEALTFWTDSANLPTPDPDKNEVTGKDGRSVARGGAGQKMPGFIGGHPGTSNGSGNRNLYYEQDSDVKPLNATVGIAGEAYVQTNFGAADAAEAKTILEFARGLDVTDDDGDNQVNEARSWILGDPLHSRPLPINYGPRGFHSDTNPDIRIFMGTNSGFMHQIRNTDASGGHLGEEVWGFMPQAVMPIQKTLMANMSGGHPYGVDGPAQAYVKDNPPADGVPDTVWLYFGLRRGGKGIYALDVTNPDVAPIKKWSVTKTSGGNFDELGLTFSTPRVSAQDGTLYDGSAYVPAAVFAGGYDTNKDASTVGTNDSEGNAFYIVNADTGALIWKAVYGATEAYDTTTRTYSHPGLLDSIPSTVTVLDTYGNDDRIDRAYFGDTGGNIWRVDMWSHPNYWMIQKVAALGRHDPNLTGNITSDDRRFFHRIDFVPHKDANSSYDAIIVGSGDRADPLSDTVDNYQYMIKDRQILPMVSEFTINATWTGGPYPTISHSDLFDVTSNCIQDNSCSSTPNLYYGWKLELTGYGEKSLATATTLGGHIYFTTYIPPDTSNNSNDCSPDEGTGRLYTVALNDATAVVDYYVLNGTALEAEDRYRDLKSGGIPAEIVYLAQDTIMAPDLSKAKTNTKQRWKTYWYPDEL